MPDKDQKEIDEAAGPSPTLAQCPNTAPDSHQCTREEGHPPPCMGLPVIPAGTQYVS